MLDPKYIKPITRGMINKLVKAVYTLPHQSYIMRHVRKTGLRLSNLFGEKKQEMHERNQILVQKQHQLLAELDLVIKTAAKAREMVAGGEFLE